MKPETDVSFLILQRRLYAACRRLVTQEAYLFTFEVNERTLSQRLSLYLQAKFPTHAVDCEYNRNLSDKKTLPPVEPETVRSDDIKAVTVFPDILVHERGTHARNLLVIEAKRNAPISKVPEHDARKLNGFTSADGAFRYTWGVFLNFRNREEVPSFSIKWFKHGQELEDVALQRLIAAERAELAHA
jgi:hypothetical protein